MISYIYDQLKSIKSNPIQNYRNSLAVPGKQKPPKASVNFQSVDEEIEFYFEGKPSIPWLEFKANAKTSFGCSAEDIDNLKFCLCK